METTKANIQIHANCGCQIDFRQDADNPFGYTYQEVLEAAIQHTNETGHTLHVYGEIRGTRIQPQNVVVPPNWKRRNNGKE